MSSEEEDNSGGFIVHSPSWQSPEFQKLKQDLDEKYALISSQKSKRMLAKRSKGIDSQKEIPEAKAYYSWIIRDSDMN